MPAEFRSNLGAFIGATDRAMKAGLIVAAEAYMGEMRAALQEGFTSGAFVTGNLANSVARSTPETTVDGVEVSIGSTQTDPPYGLYWEVGHQNLFTGKYERQERWVPKMVEMRDQLAALVAAEIKAVDGVL